MKRVFNFFILFTLLAMSFGSLGVAPAQAATTTTTIVDSAGNIGQWTSVVLNASGFPVISYYDVANTSLKVAVCNDAACTAPTITTVDNSADVGGDTSLVLNASGFPVISYYDVANTSLKVAVCNDAACTAPTITTVDTTNGRYSSIKLNALGYPVISYRGSNVLRLAVCGNSTCTAGNTLTTVDSTANVGDTTSLALNASGFPVISYRDVTNSDLKVAVCGNATCSTGNTLTTVDSTGDVGSWTSVALNASGFPIVSYTDNTNTSLKLAVCGNATCSAGNTFTTVDNAADVGSYISLKLNASGLPIISYYDTTNTSLKLAMCGDAACSAGNTITTVDNAADVGQYTSLTLNANGFPVISYYDATNGDLKLATFTPTSAEISGGVPTLTWNTFLGGTGFDAAGRSIAVDGDGNTYLVGYSNVTWGSPIRAFTVSGTNTDSYVAKLDSSGNLLWNTFLGGTGTDYGNGLLLDPSGNIYIAGQSNVSWGSPIRAFTVNGTNSDGFVAKLDSSGNLLWNTFLGGTGVDSGSGLALDGSGNIYVSARGGTTSWGTPVRPHDPGANVDAYVAKLGSNGNLLWNTFLGGSGNDDANRLVVDGNGDVLVAGSSSATWASPIRTYTSNTDGFAAKLDTNGNLLWNTFLGGTASDVGFGLAVDTSGNVYVSGWGGNWGSPVRAFTGGNDAFVVKLNSSGTLQWNTFLGTTGDDASITLWLDGNGNLYAAGRSASAWSCSPVDCTVRPFTVNGTNTEGFVTKLDPTNGNLSWNTFLGGTGQDGNETLTIDNSGNIYAAGFSRATWQGTSAPVRAYTASDDATVAKLSIHYHVTYHANSATNGTAPANQAKISGQDLTLATNTGSLARTGYTLTGWNTQDNGLGTHYDLGGTYATEADVTLYAEWTLLTYTVSYNANNPTSGTAPATQTKYHGVDLTLAANNGSLAKTGYTLTGWNTQDDGLGTHYNLEGTYTANAATTLYAEWTINTYTVTYDGNGSTGGSVPTDPNNPYNYNTTVTVLGNTGSLVKTSSTFNGWNSAADGSGTSYSSGNTFAMPANNVTLYAQWLVIPSANGGDGPGGVGVTDGSSALELWLRADKGVYSNAGCTTAATNGQDVTCWQDQSGNSQDVKQYSTLPLPSFATNQYNSQPALSYAGNDENGEVLTTNIAAFANNPQYTLFFVFNPNNITGENLFAIGNPAIGDSIGYHPQHKGSSYIYHFASDCGSGPFNCLSSTIDNGLQLKTFRYAALTSSTDAYYFLNGTQLTSADMSALSIPANPLISVGGFANRTGSTGYEFGGTLTEAVFFSSPLPDVSRILVENYLAAKYDITMTANDVYDGDATGFDYDVAGIGMYNGNTHTQAHGAGMIVVNRTFLQGNGDWLLFGHTADVNGNTTTDLPTGGDWASAPNPMRWVRSFYIDVTDSGGGSGGTVDVIFDFSEGGMGDISNPVPVGPASNYRLLGRSGATGTFSDVTASSGATVVIVGDQVQFLNVDVSVLGSNFTVGTLDHDNSPTSVEVLDLSARQAASPLPVALLAMLASAGLLLLRRRRKAA